MNPISLLMLSCEEVGERTSAWLDDELGWWEGRLVNFHIKRCAMCRSVYEQYRSMKQSLAELGEGGGAALDPEVRSGLMAEFRGSVDRDG